MTNQKIAEIFLEIAQLLELKGENPFRIRAYQRAAQNIENLPEDISKLAEENKLEQLPGIGKDLAGKIKEIISTGKLDYLQQLRKEFPSQLVSLLAIPGLGPKTVKLLYDKLGIETIDQLEQAVESGRLSSLPGIKKKTEENILKGISLFKSGLQRMLYIHAQALAEKMYSYLQANLAVQLISYAGSLRRKRDTIGDIDILVASKEPKKVMNLVINHPQVKDVLAVGESKASVIFGEKRAQVDVRTVKKSEFGAALLYFTGSKQFNIKLRQLAIKQGYKINEYGVFKNNKKVAGKSEEDIFNLFNMQFIPPELREDRGEVELSLQRKLPDLVNRQIIKGDFHVHSVYSDGRNTLEEIAQTGIELGYEYIGIADHSQSLYVANGLDIDRVYQKIEHIKKINRSLKRIKLLAATEVDILSDGKLDYPDQVLKEFDLVIASIHSGFKQSKQQLTKRIICACKNKYVHIIGHPTGRLWGQRDSFELDFQEIFKAARDYQVALEINSYPLRLDLNDINCFAARQNNVMLALGTDAHRREDMEMIELGINVARRGWVEKKGLLNCLEYKELKKWLKKY